MAWFVLARLLFGGAVVYSAMLLRPLGPAPLANLLFGAGLAALAVVFEWRLRETPVSHMLGALVGGPGSTTLACLGGAQVDRHDQRGYARGPGVRRRRSAVSPTPLVPHDDRQRRPRGQLRRERDPQFTGAAGEPGGALAVDDHLRHRQRLGDIEGELT